MLWDDFFLVHVVTFVICTFTVLILRRKGFRHLLFGLLLVSIILLSFYLKYEVIFGLCMGICLAILILVLFKFGRDPVARKVLAGAVVFIILLPFLVSPLPCFLQNGFGYDVCDGKIIIKTYPWGREVVDINSSRIVLTSNDSWKPKWRIHGYAEFDTQMGYYTLKNGKKAIVFMHGYYDKIMVINSNGKYYVIIHPGIERTYEKIRNLFTLERNTKVGHC